MDTATDLTREIITEHIKGIAIPAPNHLTYTFTDGTVLTIEWQHKSRRESWTPEMREMARQKTSNRYKKEVAE